MADNSTHSTNVAHGKACRPPRGRTYLTVGQDFFSIEEYVLSQYNASLHRTGENLIDKDYRKNPTSKTLPLTYFHPAATMVYTDIYELKGLDQPADYGSGIEYVKGLSEAFPVSGLQIGLWLNGYEGCRDIVSGILDDKIYRLFHFIQSELPASTPKVFLRIGYEFDNPWFGYSEDPSLYQEAFRKLVLSCERQMAPNLCHDKIDFVWHSWGAPRKDGVSLNDFYPGDYFVDWVGVSVFQQFYPWANDEKNTEGNFAGGNMNQVKEVLQFAKRRKKATMIAESTPFGGMNVVESSIAKDYTTDENGVGTIWELWFQKTIDLIEEFDISMWSYINCDWDSQPMWNNVGFGDTRLSSSDVVMNQWWEQVLKKNSRFLRRIGGCGEGSYHGDDHMKEEKRLMPEYAESTKSGGLSELVDVEYTNQEVGSVVMDSQLPHAFCSVGAMALLLLLMLRIVRKRHNEDRKQSILATFVTPDTSYGSLE